MSSGGTTTTIVVDAVLDEAAKPTQTGGAVNETESASSETYSLNMDASFVSAGFDNMLPAPATGGDSGDGGTDTDGSESITRIFIDFDAVAGATLILSDAPGGVTLIAADGATPGVPPGTEWEIVGFTSDAEAIAATEALSVQLAASFEGSLSGSVTVRTKESTLRAGFESHAARANLRTRSMTEAA